MSYFPYYFIEEFFHTYFFTLIIGRLLPLILILVFTSKQKTERQALMMERAGQLAFLRQAEHSELDA